MSQVLDPQLVVQPMDAALAAVDAALDQVAAVRTATLTEAQLLESVSAMRRQRSRCDAELLRLVADVESRAAARGQGSTSTAGWLRSEVGMHPGEAKRVVGLANALHADPPLPEPGQGPDWFLDGVGDAPGNAGSAGSGSAGGVAGVGLPGLLAPTREALAAGAISVEHAGVIEAALRGLPEGLDPVLLARGEALLVDQAQVCDPSSLAMLGRGLLHRLDPGAGKLLADREQDLVEKREFSVSPRREGGYTVRGLLDDELGAGLLAALSPYAAPDPRDKQTGDVDLRSPGRRNADALADLIALATSHPDVKNVHDARPTVVVTMDMATLVRELGAHAGMLEFGGPLSAEAARRLACDARIIPVVMGANSEPLDVGRASYSVPAGMRRALVARDGGCAFPGCGRPPGWCDAHHCRHWADGGETKLSNTVLLCPVHHRVVHHDGWTVYVAANGLPEFIAPTWLNFTSTPLPQQRKPWRAELAAQPTPRTADD